MGHYEIASSDKWHYAHSLNSSAKNKLKRCFSWSQQQCGGDVVTAWPFVHFKQCQCGTKEPVIEGRFVTFDFSPQCVSQSTFQNLTSNLVIYPAERVWREVGSEWEWERKIASLRVNLFGSHFCHLMSLFPTVCKWRNFHLQVFFSLSSKNSSPQLLKCFLSISRWMVAFCITPLFDSINVSGCIVKANLF